MAKKELAVKKQDTALAEVPEYLKKGAGRGMEKADQKDILFPRVTLLQAGSPSVKDKTMEAGLIVDSISGKPFDGSDGTELLFIPVLLFKSRTMFEGIGKEAKALCTAQDGVTSQEGTKCASCDSAKWVTDKRSGKSVKPACTEFYNFPIVILGGKQPMISALSLSHTKIKTAKKLLTLVQHTGRDMFAHKFRLSVVEETSPSGVYFNYDIEGAGFPSEGEYKFAEQFYLSAKNKNLAVEAEQSEAVATAPANGKKHKAI